MRRFLKPFLIASALSLALAANVGEAAFVVNIPIGPGTPASAGSGGAGIKMVDMGQSAYSASCEITATSGVKCWGDNSGGEVGNGTTSSQSSPVLSPVAVQGLPAATYAGVSTDYLQSCAWVQNGPAYCWGNGSGVAAQVAGLTNVTQIVSGYQHFCAIDGGVAKCWGYNVYGQTGIGSTSPGIVNSPTPVDMTNVSGNFVSLDAGADMTCGLTDSHNVYCWGINSWGQTGSGTTSSTEPSPVPVYGMNGSAAAVSVGSGFACALSTGGEVVCWGADNYNQLGDGYAQQYVAYPKLIYNGGIKQVSAGYQSICVLKTDSTVECLGGYFSNGTARVAITGFTGTPKQIDWGNAAGCATVSDGSAECWGSNAEGQLGDGGVTTKTSTPVKVAN